MTAALQTFVTVEEYLRLERASEIKHEYFRGQMYAMAGASLPHNTIVGNLLRHLGNALEGGPCRPYPSDLRVRCTKGLYTYPDVVIVCGPPELEDSNSDTLLNPRVVIEVLSPTTERYNRGDKFDHYSEIASLREYVLIATDTADIDHYFRESIDHIWRHSPLRAIDAELIFNSVSCSLPVRSIYDGVTLEPISFPISPRIAPPPDQNGSSGTTNP